MEPISIIGLLASIGGVTNVIAKSIESLSNFKTKYRDAPFTIQILLGQLCTIRTALNQLKDWSESHLDTNPRYEELSHQVSDALISFSPLIMNLQAQLDVHELEERRKMPLKKRLSYVWNERTLTTYFQMLDTQVNALTLLLQAVQCKTWTDQRDLLSTTDSKVILRAAKDCASSVLAQRDGVSSRGTASLFENGDAFSQDFEFDDVLLQSKVYSITYRSHLKQVASNVKLPMQSIAEVQPSSSELVVNPFADPSGDEPLSLPDSFPPTIHGRIEDSNLGMYDMLEAITSVATDVHPVEEVIDAQPATIDMQDQSSTLPLPTPQLTSPDTGSSHTKAPKDDNHGTLTPQPFALTAKPDGRGQIHYEFRYGISSKFRTKFFNQANTDIITRLIEHSQIRSAKMIHFTTPKTSDNSQQVPALTGLPFTTALGWLIRYFSVNPDWNEVPSTIPDFANRRLGLDNLGMTLVVNQREFQGQLIKATVTLAYKRTSVHRTMRGQWKRWPEILVWVV